MIHGDPLLAHRLIAAKWESELQVVSDAQAAQGTDTLASRVEDNKKFYLKAKRVVDETIVNTEGDRRVFSFRWSFINKVLCVLFLVHTYVLSLFGSDVSSSFVHWSSCGFCIVYATELVLRIVSVGGWVLGLK